MHLNFNHLVIAKIYLYKNIQHLLISLKKSIIVSFIFVGLASIILKIEQ